VPVISHTPYTAPAIPRHERFAHNLLGRLQRLQAMRAPTVEEIEEKLFLEEHFKQREAKEKHLTAEARRCCARRELKDQPTQIQNIL
jgi:hypothetical protein